MRTETNDTTAKPFLKWAGGKSQLIKEIEKYYPFDNGEITKYAEPFVGSGAVLFDILNRYNLKEVYISDINNELINAYKTVRDNINELIELLSHMQKEFIPLDNKNRKEYYLKKRNLFNTLKLNNDKESNIIKAALLIFLNKTCFNGLYRVNKKGYYNVPMGAYKNPLICNVNNLRAASHKLQNVTIVCGDYSKAADFIDCKTFVYFDPPYRPLTATASFTSYANNNFDDNEQRRLAQFVKKMGQAGAKTVVSNSDPKNTDENDDFFEQMYSSLNIIRVQAARMINSNSNARGKISELLIANY